jgi:hypothetical protein
MNRPTSFAVISLAALAFLAACESSNVASPLSAGGSVLDRGGPRPTCTISLPAPANRPLPAVRETARELNEAFSRASSSVECGTVNGIGQRFNVLISKLDQPDEDQNLDAACGIAGSIVNELEALVRNGQFNPIVTHPPQAGPNVVENMDFIRSQFCANAGR